VANYDFATLLDRNMMHMGIMFEKQAWVEVGGYREQMKDGREDWAFNVALGERGYCGIKIGRSGYLYRRHGLNRTMTNTSLEWREHFRMQMEQLFPHLYRGLALSEAERDWPMACCGKSKRNNSNSSAPRGIARATMPLGGDMVLIEYTGRSIGSSTWGGPGAVPSGRYYRFGGNGRDKVKYVERNDVQWFLDRREDDRQLFAIHQEEPSVQPLNSATVATTGDLIVKVQRIVEAPDPDALTVREIYALELTPEQWQWLEEKEAGGKNRATVFAFAKGKINLAQPVA
jgi:hypothetical protein